MESLERYDVALHGYVLMGNHYHLIAETRRANLSRLREIGELFGGAGYTAVAQMIRRTWEKEENGTLQFKFDQLMRKCVK
jgi:hypothetical protein